MVTVSIAVGAIVGGAGEGSSDGCSVILKIGSWLGLDEVFQGDGIVGGAVKIELGLNEGLGAGSI
jgi:hypothetical protein